MRAAPRAASAWPSEARPAARDCLGTLGGCVGVLVNAANAAGPPVTSPAVLASDSRVSVGRLVRSVDFQRVLAVRSRWQSPHFAIHHLADWPMTRQRAVAAKLSTGPAPESVIPVDDLQPSAVLSVVSSASTATGRPPQGDVWLGAVVPKRHARRAVTRSLVKRQIRAVASQHAAALGGGLWVVRLRAPYDRQQFPSAASLALARTVRAELRGVFERAAARGGS